MCGILGIAGKHRVTPDAFVAALDTLAMRGPDDSGVFEHESLLLGHRRLSIIDTSKAGHQPMTSADGRYVIVFNGEIYNFAALATELQAEGVVFRSHCDTEVLLELFARHGAASVARLRGMFAFAIYDRSERSLFLARDRMGIKPLYVWRTPGAIAFASEIRALRRLPGGPAAVNRASLAEYLHWGSIPEPLTMLEGVEPLAPGTTLTWKDSSETIATYWTLPAGDGSVTDRGDALSLVREALREAVALHCISDVPLGAFLSGGIDSSAIVSLMRDAGHEKICTFSISFPQSELDEGPYAIRVAEELQTSHENISVTEGLVRSELDNFFTAMDQPTCDGFNTYLVSRFARQSGLTVSLSGIGGDELFAGYPTFRRADRAVPLLSKLPHFLRVFASREVSTLSLRLRKLENLTVDRDPSVAAYRLLRGIFSPSQCYGLLDGPRRGRRPFLPLGSNPELRNPKSSSTVYTMMQLEMRQYMLNQLLRDTDVFGMTHSLEIRPPLVDHVLVEKLFSIDPGLILEGSQKALLRDALPSPLPREVTHRPKMGFTFPFDGWIRDHWAKFMLDTTREAKLDGAPLFDTRAVSAIFEAHSEHKLHWSRPWTLYALARGMEAHA